MQPFGTLQASTINIPTGADVSIKVAGQTESYDSHCLRAYYYWKEQMPDIQQAKDDELCIKLNGEYLKSDDVIHYKGKSYTVKEFYETFR